MKKLIFTWHFFVQVFIISLLYIAIFAFIMNSSLIVDALTGSFSLEYKFSLISALIQGVWTSMGGAGFIILTFTALLTGANLALLWQYIRAVKGFKNLHIVMSGNVVLGLVGSGCAACGLPLLSLLGLSGVILYLPFHGTELSYIAIFLLLISFFLLMRSVQQSQACKVPVRI